ncbi:MAG: hypothetical protein H6672_06680 [Anaerolineaceae bacterium]|nr:hypothetical protein [Anaerolineaceae bacterium]
MASLGRTIATVAIWMMVTGIIITGMIMEYDAGGIAVLALIMGIGAAIATEKIWLTEGESKDARDRERREKAKRRSMVDRMLERLDESQLNELRARLMSEQDGEAVSLEDLLEEQARRKEQY